MEKIMPFIGIENKAEAVYSKFTFEEFWEFINPKNKYIYEFRMKTPRKGEKNREYIRKLGKALKIPYHWTGVFCKTPAQFKAICFFCIKNKLTLYLSANPKRKSIHSKAKKSWECYNGEMQSDLGFYSILLDFDATKYAKKNLKDTTEVCYREAKRFLEESKNIKKYCLLSSGNGCQIRIPLDEFIPLPKSTYKGLVFSPTEEFNIYRRILKKAMEENLCKYGNKFVNIDTSSLELARVGRSPFSINFKDEENLKYSGVIEIVDRGENIGLSEHIMSYYDKVELIEQKKDFHKNTTIAEEFNYGLSTIQKCPLVKLLLKSGLPEGGRNNKLFFQFKLLCKNNGLNFSEPVISELIERMRIAQNHSFTTNDPGDSIFNPEVVVNWCIENQIKSPYPVLYNIKKKRDLKQDLNDYKIATHNIVIPPGATIKGRLYQYIKHLNMNYVALNIFNIQINMLLGAIHNTFGREFTEYIIESGTLKEILEKV